MAYSPDPEPKPTVDVKMVVITTCLITALFLFAPVIVRALYQHWT